MAEVKNINEQLISAINRGNVDVAKALMLQGANVLSVPPGIAASRYIYYAVERAKEDKSAYPAAEMSKLFSQFEVVDKQFEKKFAEPMLEAITTLTKTKGGIDNITADDIITACKLALSKAYESGFADKVKGAVQNDIESDIEFCKLDFIDKFFIALQSLVSSKTFQELAASELADNIYKEVTNSRAFKDLAAPEVGKSFQAALAQEEKGAPTLSK